MKFQKYIYMAFLFLVTTNAANATFARGSEGGNGGDPLELRFMEIGFNLSQWIQSGRSEALRLPSGISNEDYVVRMTNVLQKYHVSFTSMPIFVNGAQKVCKNFLNDSSEPEIICDREFGNFSDEDQYRLVHHEFAGLAGIEVNNGPDSNYIVSAQISAFLEKETIRRLPVSVLHNGKPLSRREWLQDSVLGRGQVSSESPEICQAVFSNDLKRARVLLATGASVNVNCTGTSIDANAKYDWNVSPLFLGLYKNLSDDFLNAMIDAGAAPNDTYATKRTQRRCNHLSQGHWTNCHWETIQLVLGKTVSQLISLGRAEVLEHLFEKNVSIPDFMDANGIFCGWSSAMNGFGSGVEKVQIFAVLEKKGASPFGEKAYGRGCEAALSTAIYSPTLPLVEKQNFMKKWDFSDSRNFLNPVGYFVDAIPHVFKYASNYKIDALLKDEQLTSLFDTLWNRGTITIEDINANEGELLMLAQKWHLTKLAAYLHDLGAVAQ